MYFRGAAAEEDRRDDLWQWFAVACVVCLLGETASLWRFEPRDRMSHITLDPYIPLALWVPLAAGRGGAVGRLCGGQPRAGSPARAVGRSSR